MDFDRTSGLNSLPRMSTRFVVWFLIDLPSFLNGTAEGSFGTSSCRDFGFPFCFSIR